MQNIYGTFRAVIFGIVVLGLATSCSMIENSGQLVGDENENITLIQRNYEEIWNQGDLTVVNEIYSNNYVGHDSHSSATRHGLEGVTQHVSMYRTAFPNLFFAVEDVIASGDKVAVRWTASGKNMGEMMGMAPTERQVTLMGISIFRISQGEIEESWFGWDKMDMMQQLGMISPVKSTEE